MYKYTRFAFVLDWVLMITLSNGLGILGGYNRHNKLLSQIGQECDEFTVWK